LLAAKDKVPNQAVTGLQARACDDGGLPRATCLFGSDVASTALALNALAKAGVGNSDPMYERARAFLLAAQNSDGGFGYGVRQATVAQPTAGVISALFAMGEDPAVAPWHRGDNADAVTALASLQDASGGVRADTNATAPDPLTTARVVPGLSLRALPIEKGAVPNNETPTTVAPSRREGGTTTTVAATQPTVVRRSKSSSPAPAATVPGQAPPEVGLAAPARREGTEAGRSVLAMAPLAATLFGAGALGLVLRRRART
jgi:hypothetical protein